MSKVNNLTFNMVDKSITKPKILVLDNEWHQVEGLIKYDLGEEDYSIVYISNSNEALEHIENNIVQIALIDVALLDKSDTMGLTIGKTISEKFRDTVNICISRKSIVKLKAEQIISAMNPLPEKNGSRIFYAFGEKTKNEIVQHIKTYRRQLVCNEDVEIYIEESFNSEISALLSNIYGKEIKVAEPFKQFIEIVKQIARNPHMPKVERIRLIKIGKGRSRTIVCRMILEYGEEHMPFERIVKIGLNELIEKEVDNYSKYVPQFLEHGQYPTLESLGVSRDLSGLAYGRIGDFNDKGLPPSLRERMTMYDHNGQEIIADTKNSNSAIKDVFLQMSKLKPPQKPKIGVTLKVEYENRFRDLKNTDLLVNKYYMGIKELENHKLAIAQGEKQVKLNKNGNRSIKSLDDLLSDRVAYERHLQSVVHGDLHLDNVVFRGKSNTEPFFIDFAHSEHHHVYMDHIVMELGIRFQLTKDTLIGLLANKKYLLSQILDLECALCDVFTKNTNIKEIENSEFKKIFEVICEIRAQAAMRWQKEEHQRYLAGMGLTLAAAVSLPKNEENRDVKEMYGHWFSIASAIHLTTYEEAVVQKEELPKMRDDKYSLWNYTKLISIDDRIASTLGILSKTLENTLVKELSALTQRMDIINDKVANTNDEVDEIKVLLEKDLPATSDLLKQILENVNTEGGVESKVVMGLGLPFLMLQLEKKVNMPGNIMKAVNRFRRRFDQDAT